jgi:coenzyme Q-binding protein COQ10
MPRAESEILIDAPRDRVFDVIVDYERYPEFLPDMRVSQVVSRHDGVAVVRFELELVMKLSYTLRLVEDRPSRVSWSLEEAKMMVENEGGWTLTEKDGKTHARYGLEIKLRGLIPKTVTTRLVGQTLPDTLRRFKDRIEKGR